MGLGVGEPRMKADGEQVWGGGIFHTSQESLERRTGALEQGGTASHLLRNWSGGGWGLGGGVCSGILV